MDKLLTKPIFSVLLLIILSAYLFFFQLGNIALTDPDEAFYGQTAKEMLNRGEWLTPYLYGNPQFEKPILFYLLVKVSFMIFGVTEFAARFPSAIFGLLGIIAIYLLGTLLFNNRVGLLSAVILATNVEYIVLSRACVTDMTLFVFMLFGILFFFCGYLKKGGYFYLLSAASFGLATLTKGPIAIILAGAVFIAYLLWIRDTKVIKNVPIIEYILVFLVITVPWYLLMYKLHGRGFIDTFFGFHNITRFLESEHAIGSQVYYNVPVVLAGFFPWSVFLPFGFWHIIKKIRNQKSEVRNEKRHLIFILIWFLVIFIFFSISSTKLPTYVLPSFISLALVAAIFWDDFLRKDTSQTVVGISLSYYILFIVIIPGVGLALNFINFDYPSILLESFISSLFLIFGMAFSFATFIRRKFTSAFFLIVYSVILFLYPTSKLILPKIEPYETSKEISQKVLTLLKGDEKLGAESHYLAGLAFYTNKIPINLDRHHVLVDFLNSKNNVWCVLKEKNHIQLYELNTEPLYMKPSYMVYKFDKKAILTNKLPPNGRYILKRDRPK